MDQDYKKTCRISLEIQCWSFPVFPQFWQKRINYKETTSVTYSKTVRPSWMVWSNCHQIRNLATKTLDEKRLSGWTVATRLVGKIDSNQGWSSSSRFLSSPRLLFYRLTQRNQFNFICSQMHPIWHMQLFCMPYSSIPRDSLLSML